MVIIDEALELDTYICLHVLYYNIVSRSWQCVHFINVFINENMWLQLIYLGEDW
jgi:hypothetical protein